MVDREQGAEHLDVGQRDAPAVSQNASAVSQNAAAVGQNAAVNQIAAALEPGAPYIQLRSLQERPLTIARARQIILENAATVERLKSKRAMIRWICEDAAINFNRTMHRIRPAGRCRILGHGPSVAVLASLTLMTHGGKFGVRIFRQMASDAIAFLDRFVPQKGDSCALISRQTIWNVLQLPLNRRLLAIMPKDQELTILNVDLATKDLNSFSFPPVYTVINTRNSKSAREVTSDVQIFIHELGHIFQFAATGSQEVYPPGFPDLFDSMSHTRFDTLDVHTQQEVFADYYSMACCANTEYDQANFLNRHFLGRHVQQISEYFLGLQP